MCGSGALIAACDAAWTLLSCRLPAQSRSPTHKAAYKLQLQGLQCRHCTVYWKQTVHSLFDLTRVSCRGQLSG